MRSFSISLKRAPLPTSAEACDNLLLWIAEQQDGRPGKWVPFPSDIPAALLGIVGAVCWDDIGWIARSPDSRAFVEITGKGTAHQLLVLTADGWERVGASKRAQFSAKFAFLARHFKNPDLDNVS